MKDGDKKTPLDLAKRSVKPALTKQRRNTSHSPSLPPSLLLLPRTETLEYEGRRQEDASGPGFGKRGACARGSGSDFVGSREEDSGSDGGGPRLKKGGREGRREGGIGCGRRRKDGLGREGWKRKRREKQDNELCTIMRFGGGRKERSAVGRNRGKEDVLVCVLRRKERKGGKQEW